MEDSENIAAIGNLMTTTAKINNLEGFVIDGAAEILVLSRNSTFCLYKKLVQLLQSENGPLAKIFL